MKKVLITGVAGFIGSSLAKRLIDSFEIVGIDNFDPFYDKSIKERNLSSIISHTNFNFIEADVRDINKLRIESIDVVIHLAAKAGVLPSLSNPKDYYENNVLGTLVILEWMRSKNIKSIIYASSSSVYGNTQVPFIESAKTEKSISIYASSKKSGELLIHNYHHLYQMKCIILRFFTVYGPGQRPDLAIHKFVKLINNDQEIQMYGNGESSRDYTYIDDIVQGIQNAMHYLKNRNECFEVFNLGGNNPISLKNLISIIGKELNKTVKINHLPMQSGDVNKTYADLSKSERLLSYSPSITIEEGINIFIKWFKSK